MPLDNPHLFRPGNVSGLEHPQGFEYFGQPLINHEVSETTMFTHMTAFSFRVAFRRVVAMQC